MHSGYECLGALFALPHVLCVTVLSLKESQAYIFSQEFCFCSSAAVCRVGVGFSREVQQEHS